MRNTVNHLLGAATASERLANLRRLVEGNEHGILDIPPTDEVNNHVHTVYSFSPYTPAHAAWAAREAGLQAVGSVDHDSIAAADEMIEACRIIGIGSTVGYELRVSFMETAFGDRRLNNPDSIGIGYMAVHGVPRPMIPTVSEFLAPLQEERNRRNRLQVDKLNKLLDELSAPRVTLEDVMGNSRASEGGSVTERHILYTAAQGLMQWIAPGPPLRRWIEDHLAGQLPERLQSYLDDPDNPHYVYDVIGVLKSSFLPRFFIQPSAEECVPVTVAVEFANSMGAIPAYAYLGDVAESPTGDKKAESFEDDYLDELVAELTRIRFRSVTYMPPRNTREQLTRVQRLCARHGLMEISGVDINSSRQSFNCPEILEADFHHLIDSTWALIAHEKLSSLDPSLSLFRQPGTLDERIRQYAAIGRRIDPAKPEEADKALSRRTQ